MPLRALQIVCLSTVLCGWVALAGAGQGKKELPAKPLDLNTATVEQLQQLPGIGVTIAKRIVHFRDNSGPFTRVEDLLVIRGISKARLEKLRPYIMTGPPPPPKKSGP